jgi:phage repressor protein C with HTH and peptisase S24 domain
MTTPPPRIDQAFNGGAKKLPNQEFVALISAVLDQGRPFRFQAPGVSMSPLIRDGDTLTLAPLAGRTPRLGDVLAFISPATNTLMVHRVVTVRHGRLLLKADNGTRPDGWVDPQGILGRVVRVDHQGQPYSNGLGPERALIALLSRLNLLQPGLRLYWQLIGRHRQVNAP